MESSCSVIQKPRNTAVRVNNTERGGGGAQRPRCLRRQRARARRPPGLASSWQGGDARGLSTPETLFPRCQLLKIETLEPEIQTPSAVCRVLATGR